MFNLKRIPLKCLELVIINWKDLYPDGTWSDIFTSLVKMGKTELSHILQEKYLNRPKVPGELSKLYIPMCSILHSHIQYCFILYSSFLLLLLSHS